MDSMDEDMFAISDEELPISTPKCNPIEEYLMKQLSNVQIRIAKTKNDIKEVQDMTKCVLESLYSQAQYGKDITSDSDSNLYTIDRQPVVKKTESNVNEYLCEFLVVKSDWKYVISDKWVIGIELTNNVKKTLKNPQIYVSVEENDEFCGTWIIWNLKNETFWYPIDEIQSCTTVVATVVLDLPKFDKNSSCDVYGTISYEVDDKEYQTPLPIICLTVEDTINDKYQVNFSTRKNYQIKDAVSPTLFMILALKSTSVEKTINVQFKENLEKQKQFLCFLEKKSFQAIYHNIYIVQTACGLLHCLIEILPNIEGKERLTIFSRSNQQMNIMLRFLRDQFPDMNIEEDNNPIRAAKALVEELKLYLEDASTAERQMARIRTDLLIP